MKKSVLWLFMLLFTSSATVVLAQLPGDVNNDGTVDIFDLSIISNHYGTSNPIGDVNEDGKVDIFDIAIASSNYQGAGPLPTATDTTVPTVSNPTTTSTSVPTDTPISTNTPTNTATSTVPVNSPIPVPTDTPIPTDTPVPTETPASNSISIKGEVWADNWFAFYLNDNLVAEDSVPITTERSFNAEAFTFTADYPFVLNLIMKDFKENDTGLEYIGANNQQMGDGGLIAQFTETSTGQVIAVSNSDWKCTVIHEAPLDKSCANETNPVAGVAPCDFISLDEPVGWKLINFDDTGWTNATLYTTEQVRPKDGYDQISWNPNARLIWGADLETDNSILCRLKIDTP
ncbi:dockerin type I domain-containing protein [Anaerolineales bacterium HSG6]|nr:dockerin type I domain-containing protein [Anaerolineales bacterium HSG6]